MMHMKVIQYQKHLATSIFNQSGYKFEQQLAIHGSLIHHKPYLALIGEL